MRTVTNFCSSNQFDASILGLEEELRRKTPHAATTPAAVGTPHVNGSTPGGASTVSGGAGGDDVRPRRKKRRRYDEVSYEGYEQFDGEEDAPVNNGSGGNGSGGGGMMGGGGWNEEKKKKKRKKVRKSSRSMFLFALSFGLAGWCTASGDRFSAEVEGKKKTGWITVLVILFMMIGALQETFAIFILV